MDGDIKKELAYLNSLVSDNKREVISRVIQNRTNYITVVLENLTQPHNGSAVIRSCDIFGVQNLHVIEQIAKFKAEVTIAKGANKWIDIHRHTTTAGAIAELKKQGYRIVATTPHERGYSIKDLPVDKKRALFFGTEITGLSDEMLEQADDFVTIPMFGFTESFNISVSVALCLYELINKVHASSTLWQLTDQERELLQLKWLKRVLHISK
jgi:tRNA (guanosine-2'-O-)-methyltransferase